MEINKLRSLCNYSAIKWSAHCLARMQERDISRSDIKNCILNGEIIEDYPTDFPHPSCLIFGNTIDKRVLHVVVGTDGTYAYIITAYFPSTEKFEIDLKTRKGC